MTKEDIIRKIEDLQSGSLRQYEATGLLSVAWAIIYLAKAIEERPVNGKRSEVRRF